MADIKILNPDALGKPLGQYSHLTRVKASEFVFIAGQVGVDRDGKVVGVDDFDAQCVQTFANIEAALKSVGAGWGNIVQFTTYLVHSQDIPKFMVKACLDRFGRVDVLVNNVGGSAAGGPVEMSEDVWDAQVDYNLKSVFLTLKHVLPVMERQKSGAIVNIASTSGLRWTGSAQVGYAATKAGVIQLSRVVAVQYADKGIRVNTVVPGQLHTQMVEARLAGQRAGGDVEALLKSRLERIPIGFMPSAIHFSASTPAGGFTHSAG